jgi:hypothetical protein
VSTIGFLVINGNANIHPVWVAVIVRSIAARVSHKSSIAPVNVDDI